MQQQQVYQTSLKDQSVTIGLHGFLTKIDLAVRSLGNM